VSHSAPVIWLAVAVAGLLTYATRLSFILLLERLPVPALVRRGLRFVPVAVLTAIIVPELILPGGELNVGPGNFRLLAGLLAILVARLTRNALATIVAGMVALTLLQTFFGGS
jgi:branched-subunit amino acid transport protein